MANEPAVGSSRETRLLLATIAVSVAMLFLLARFRFPEEAARQTAEPAPAPLERLAARATFDELASVMADLERRILPAIGTLSGESDDGTVLVPAVRVSDDRAVAMIPGELRVRSAQSDTSPAIMLRDPLRDLVVVHAPRKPDSAPVVPSPGTRPGPRYVAVVEASAGIPAVRPLYVGRTDLFTDPRWTDPLIQAAAVQEAITPGAAVFNLDGAFIGLATPGGSRVTIVPASTLRNIAVGAPASLVKAGHLPLEVQPLTSDLAKAAGASHGVMISYVADSTLPLVSGDVVQSVGGTDVRTVAGYHTLVQKSTPGETLNLGIVRRGNTQTVAVTPREASGPAGSSSQQDLGTVLRAVAGIGAEVVAVRDGSPADAAGIRRGDLIIAADGQPSPDPAAVLRRYRGAEPSELLLLTLRRNGNHRVVAVERR